MDHKTAINILLKLLDKNSLTQEEREATLTAIGVLSWTQLAQSRLKILGKSRHVAKDAALSRKNILRRRP